jgi:hypothetical protein
MFMFFRREKTPPPTFDALMEKLRSKGFATAPEPGGATRVSRSGCAAIVKPKPDGSPVVDKPGVLLGSEIAVLADTGYQKIWLAPGGARAAATAKHLKALHAFEEDLKEELGLISLYNESLGTVNELHLYDRVVNRDQGVPKRPWEN